MGDACVSLAGGHPGWVIGIVLGLGSGLYTGPWLVLRAQKFGQQVLPAGLVSSSSYRCFCSTWFVDDAEDEGPALMQYPVKELWLMFSRRVDTWIAVGGRYVTLLRVSLGFDEYILGVEEK